MAVTIEAPNPSAAQTAAGLRQPGALAGVKVLELGTLIAGPFCARMLGEFGAEVIKIESLPDAQGKGGDPLRTWRILHEGTSLWWSVQARNKRSVCIDLKSVDGQSIVRRLAAEADLIVENFRPGVLDKMGLGYEALKAINPSCIMVRLSGYGQTGPMANEPGFGAVGESMGGIRYVSGYPDRPPVRIGISIGDSIAALHGVIGALTALHHRDATGGRPQWQEGQWQRGGEGQMVDVALYESVFNLMESLVPEYSAAGFVRERTGGSLPGIVPSNTYTTQDGENIVVAGNGDAIFKRLMRAIGRDDMADDPALATNDGRVPQTAAIDRAIADWCAAHPIDEALAVLKAADVPVSKIFSVADMMRDPQFLARHMFESHVLADGTPVQLPAVVPKLSATPGGTRWVGPRLGQHTEEVLQALGYDDERISAWRAEGTVYF